MHYLLYMFSLKLFYDKIRIFTGHIVKYFRQGMKIQYQKKAEKQQGYKSTLGRNTNKEKRLLDGSEGINEKEKIIAAEANTNLSKDKPLKLLDKDKSRSESSLLGDKVDHCIKIIPIRRSFSIDVFCL